MRDAKKAVYLRPETHQQVKLLAVENERKINRDLLDDLVMLGIEAYHKAKKILPAG